MADGGRPPPGGPWGVVYSSMASMPVGISVERDGVDDALVHVGSDIAAGPGGAAAAAILGQLDLDADLWEVVARDGAVLDDTHALAGGDAERVHVRPTALHLARGQLHMQGYRGGCQAEWDGWLLEALSEGNTEVAVLLVDARMASVEALATRFTLACAGDDLEVVKMLAGLVRRASRGGRAAGAVLADMAEALMNAVGAGHTCIAAYLLEDCGVDANAGPLGPHGLAQMACMLETGRGGVGDEGGGMLGLLLRHGLRIHEVPPFVIGHVLRQPAGAGGVLEAYLQQSPTDDLPMRLPVLLHAAVGGRRVDAVRTLLKHGAAPDGGVCGPNIVVPKTHTPLMAAAKAGALDICNILIDAGADVNAQDFYDRNVLSNAANDEVAALLRARGAR